MRTMRTSALAAIVAVTALALAACTGGESATTEAAGPTASGGSASAPAAPEPEATDADAAPSPSPTSTGVLPALTSDLALDLLTDAREARGIVGRKVELRDTATGTVEYPGERIVKPTRCLNVDALLDWGAPGSPTIGTTTSVSLGMKRGFVYQTITPSDQAIAVVDYLREQAAGPCREYTAASPASPIINDGPSKDIDTTIYGEERTFDASGTPVHAFPFTLRFRSSADVSYGRPATSTKAWLLASAAGNNLVTTLAGGITGSQALEVHRGTVERVAAAATEKAAASGLAAPAAFEPAGRDSAPSDDGSPAQDDPTWPIDEIAREARAQWQGDKPSLKQVRDMVLLVCRQMRDIEFSDPNHSATMQNLQGRIVARWDLDRITGPFDAWNLIGTADARCKGATVVTQVG
jgi:hypothetical protein